jgi:hypothetical protein
VCLEEGEKRRAWRERLSGGQAGTGDLKWLGCRNHGTVAKTLARLGG